MCGIWAIFGVDGCVSNYCGCSLKIAHRGPDCFRIENLPHFEQCCLGFHRLAIVDDLYGMQPMRIKALPYLYLIYNGEIYNHKALGKTHNFNFFTNCDGEVLLHLYDKGGAEFMASQLDGVFAFLIVDVKNQQVHIGRDPYGVRPMFTLQNAAGGFLGVSSEAKALLPLMNVQDGKKLELTPFPPGHVSSYSLTAKGKSKLLKTSRYYSVGKAPEFEINVKVDALADVKENIRTYFTEAIRKRLMSDRRIGCMLSGGLDSSLVAALLVKCAKESGLVYPVQTFSIGMSGSPDIEAARKVANHLGTEHHEVSFTAEDGIQALSDVIFSLESYDITTIRASVGMWLISKYIRETTDSVVIFSGEGADELAQGYIYFHKQPSEEMGDVESRRLLADIYLYDGLRADRSTAAHGLELRVPFLDIAFTNYYLSLDSAQRKPKNGYEKFLLRSAFDQDDLLPNEILWRPKEAFSDGVSSKTESWFQILQRFIEDKVLDEELHRASEIFPVNPPKTKEAFYYRRIFEGHFPGQSQLIPYYWMPKWMNAADPSARVLEHYK